MMGQLPPPHPYAKTPRYKPPSAWTPLLIAAGIIVLSALLGFGALRYEDSKLEDCSVCSPVDRVGGCNKYGLCGAILANGTKRDLRLPVIGEMVCYRPRKL